MKYKLFVFLILCCQRALIVSAGADDYFSEKFDEGKNCQQKILMENLMQKKDPPQCAVVTMGSNDGTRWEECKRLLSKQVVRKCSLTHVKQVQKIKKDMIKKQESPVGRGNALLQS